MSAALQVLSGAQRSSMRVSRQGVQANQLVPERLFHRNLRAPIAVGQCAAQSPRQAAAATAASRLARLAPRLRRRSSSRRSSSAPVCASAATNRQVKVSHILLPEGQDALAAQLKQRIASGGESFAALAAEHSTCPSKRWAGCSPAGGGGQKKGGERAREGCRC